MNCIRKILSGLLFCGPLLCVASEHSDPDCGAQIQQVSVTTDRESYGRSDPIHATFQNDADFDVSILPRNNCFGLVALEKHNNDDSSLDYLLCVEGVAQSILVAPGDSVVVVLRLQQNSVSQELAAASQSMTYAPGIYEGSLADLPSPSPTPLIPAIEVPQLEDYDEQPPTGEDPRTGEFRVVFDFSVSGIHGCVGQARSEPFTISD